MKCPHFTAANPSRGLFTAVVATCLTFVAVANVLADNQVVTESGDGGGANQLRAKLALAQSSGGGTITFNVGTATIMLTNVLPVVFTNVIIDGGNVITLSSDYPSPFFSVNSTGTLTLNNLTVTGAFTRDAHGGAIRNGGVAAQGGTLNINHCKFLANGVDLNFRGGAISTYGPLNITDSEFGNGQAGDAGAVYAVSPAAVLTIRGSNFHDNVVTHPTTGFGGAILLWDGASATISHSNFTANRAPARGGAIHIRPTSSLTVSATQFSGNGATYVTGQGGSIANDGTLSVIDCAFDGSWAINGGAIFTLGTASILRSSFTANYGNIGGACELWGTVTIADSSFSGNGYGPNGIPTTHDGTIRIAATGTAVLKNLTLTGNVADSGGGIFQGGTTSLENVTISGNQSRLGAGGIYQTNGALTMTNVTLYQNTSTQGVGGIKYNAGTVTVTNTIIANNTPGNCGTPLAGNAFSLSSDNTCGFGAGRDNVDPMLGPLANNGGLTQTHLPQAGSPAIDNGTASGAPPRDQRGYLRAGAAPDVGAAEFGGTIPVSLGNISTRLRVETGENALIGGFIVTGGGPKRVLLRGIGPSLSAAGHLDNPTLELYSPSGMAIGSNDNWMDAPNRQAIVDTGISPANDLESAMLMDLAPGSYTAILRGAGNTAGIGLVEAYDLDRTAASKLANISTRGLVGTGDNVLIGGFIVLGPDSQRVIVRAIGPSLPVGGALADPGLELRDGNGTLLQSNDNWRSTQEAEIIATGIPPSNDLESAIVVTLPGNGSAFTAIVRGINNVTGIALVEAYALN
ncbi:MAG: hypothetical protein DMF06_16355 [Verrucomicrobia bacterium]|nr:MAG: hypothetical protein DMF06_16355 [Verrucomicrobiota bacterium]